MGQYDEIINVSEARMKYATNPNDPITAVALAVQRHYECPWRAAEDVTLTVRREMLAAGWTLTKPNTSREAR